MALDIYSLFQVSETNEMIILVVLLVMFFVIIYDIFYRFIKFPRMITVIISGIITIFALVSGTAVRTVHVILSLGMIFGLIGFFGVIILMFIAFVLLHFGLGKLAFRFRRR
jgi:Kef-type K+ transport system membrane component KefB